MKPNAYTPVLGGGAIRTTSAVTQKLNKLRVVRKNIEELKALESQLKAAIVDYMGPNDVLYGVDGDELVTNKEVISIRLDSKRLKDELPDVYDRYSYEQAVRQFIVKKSKAN